MDHLNTVILAGGSGTRLWPLSTPGFPKQFLPLPSGRSMIQETLDRVSDLIVPERSWVVTGRATGAMVEEHLPSVPLDHILCEPMGRNSAPAVAWAAATIARQDPDAIMVTLSADHVIQKRMAFSNALRLAYQLAEQGYIVTLGIKPTAPETGFGYIRYAEEVGKGFGLSAYRGERFVEKPDYTTACGYLEDGHYVWNSGMFIWKVQTILAEIREHLPELAQKVERIVSTMGSEQERRVLDELWPTLQSISIDYGVLEKTSNLIVIPVEIGWSDVGNWEQYGSLFPADRHGIHTVGHHIGLGSQNIIVYNNTPRTIYSIGIEDIIVIEMADTTIICHKDQVQRVKELAEQQKKG